MLLISTRIKKMESISTTTKNKKSGSVDGPRTLKVHGC